MTTSFDLNEFSWWSNEYGLPKEVENADGLFLTFKHLHILRPLRLHMN